MNKNQELGSLSIIDYLVLALASSFLYLSIYLLVDIMV